MNGRNQFGQTSPHLFTEGLTIHPYQSPINRNVRHIVAKLFYTQMQNIDNEMDEE